MRPITATEFYGMLLPVMILLLITQANLYTGHLTWTNGSYMIVTLALLIFTAIRLVKSQGEKAGDAAE